MVDTESVEGDLRCLVSERRALSSRSSASLFLALSASLFASSSSATPFLRWWLEEFYQKVFE
jgi:hypothetical protein